jgi:hypothetical protein
MQSTTPSADPAIGPKSKLRFFRLTPGVWFLVLLALDAALFVSKMWIPKGWPVLIAVALVGATIPLMLLGYLFAIIFRWRFQFGIRSLLLLTIAVAIPFSWLAVEMQKAKKQQENYQAFFQRGAHLGYHYCDIESDVSGRVVRRKDFPRLPYRIENLFGPHFFFHVCDVTISNTSDFAKLNVFEELHSLNASQFPVVDADLEPIGDLQQLKELNLSFTKITDSGLKHVAALRQLQNLKLEDTGITDAGLKYLVELKELRSLNLQQTKITEAGISELEKL